MLRHSILKLTVFKVACQGLVAVSCKCREDLWAGRRLIAGGAV